MTNLVYRGITHTGEKETRTESLADQMRRPELVYRGVEHDGIRPTEASTNKEELVYRGARFA